MKNFFLQSFSKFVKLSRFTEGLVEKCCSGGRVIDLLFHFPVSLQVRSGDINNFSDKLTLVVKIINHSAPLYKAPYRVLGQTANGTCISIVYFNYRAPYIKKLLPIGETFVISGCARIVDEEVQIVHPDVIDFPSRLEYYVGVEPIYPLVAKLSNRTLRYAVNSLLNVMPEVPDWIPEICQLESFSSAIRKIHNPKTEEDLSMHTSPERYRIAVDELLANQIRFQQMRRFKLQIPAIKPTNSITKNLVLPFEFTQDQVSCLSDILSDFISGKSMNRLLQGDVGSGKTIIAFFAMLTVVENELQAAFLAPTEILAIQHFDAMKELSKDLQISIDIMLGGNRKLRAKQIDMLKSGHTQILFGTHAILENEIEFKNLGLTVIDEQHKFGVMQRLALVKKSKYPNILVMSATPIPRTLLLGHYGDLDISTIKTKPAGRQEIETSVIGISKVGDLVLSLKSTDSQIYWVCPAINESETLTDVTTRCEYLSEHFPPGSVVVLHGKMSSREKDEVIKKFKGGEFKILVSTTVIEVGIDIPNAGIIVIEHAEMFGLAQLHQLRGRVGRGSKKSYCILLYHNPVSKAGKQRMQLMKETTDGFVLSEEDLKLRGAGDILGKEQSGFNSLRFSSFSDNCQLIQAAESISRSIDLDSEEVKFLCEAFDRIDNDIIV